MKVKDQEAWDTLLEETPENTYEGRILRFAERLAGRVEEQLESGFETMGDVVEEMVNDKESYISSVQLCLVVRALAKHWEHGAELRSWYEKRQKASEERTCT